MLGSRLAVLWCGPDDLCAPLYARCIFITLFKKSGYKGRTGRSRGVTCKRSHTVYVILEGVCFKRCIFQETIVIYNDSTCVQRQKVFLCLVNRKFQLSLKIILFFYFFFFLLGLTPWRNWRKNWVVLINILETFENQYNELAVLNLNF